MATNRIEEYLEAILAKIADGTDTTVPAPAWRIEEYLAAIYSALSSGGGGGGGSGGGRFVVTFTYDEGTETWSTDKTFAECVAAWESGASMWSNYAGAMVALSFVNTDDGNLSYFGFFESNAETMSLTGYGIDAEGAYYYGN